MRMSILPRLDDPPQRVLVSRSLFLPEKASHKVESLWELSPELVDQLLEHFVDPVHGSPSKGRKTVGVMSPHVDDLIISGTEKFLTWFLKEDQGALHCWPQDKFDLTFTRQRVCWVNDAQGNKKSEWSLQVCASQLLKTPSKTKRTVAVGAYLGIKKDGELTQDTCGSKLFFCVSDITDSRCFKKTDMQNSASLHTSRTCISLMASDDESSGHSALVGFLGAVTPACTEATTASTTRKRKASDIGQGSQQPQKRAKRAASKRKRRRNTQDFTEVSQDLQTC